MRPLRILAILLLLCPLTLVAAEEHNPDPFENFNRKMFAFNDGLDRWVLRPVAKGYDFITPAPVQRGVGNLFANMYDFNATINSALQWRWDGVAYSGGRMASYRYLRGR